MTIKRLSVIKAAKERRRARRIMVGFRFVSLVSTGAVLGIIGGVDKDTIPAGRGLIWAAIALGGVALGAYFGGLME